MLKQILGKIFGNRNIFKFALILVLIFAVFFMTNFYIYCNKAAETLGSGAGEVAGTIKGIAIGISEGEKDGRDAGIHADDFEVEVKEAMVEASKLEVLVASAAIRDDFTIGTQYEAVYIYKGDAVFTVDLAEASITKEGEGVIRITIPTPGVNFVIDEEKTKKIMHWQQGYFTGHKAGGYEAYIEGRNKLDKNVEENLVGYDVLIEFAKEAAIRQITSLAKSVCGEDFDVIVEFSVEGVA